MYPEKRCSQCRSPDGSRKEVQLTSGSMDRQSNSSCQLCQRREWVMLLQRRVMFGGEVKESFTNAGPSVCPVSCLACGDFSDSLSCKFSSHQPPQPSTQCDYGILRSVTTQDRSRASSDVRMRKAVKSIPRGRLWCLAYLELWCLPLQY